MNKDLVQQGGVDVTVYGEYSTGELDTIRSTIAKDCTNDQFKLFMKTAAAMGLNPFLGHIHPVVYKGAMSLQVSVEGYDYKAKENPDYISVDVQLVHENDIFEAEQVEVDGQQHFKIVIHKVKFPRGIAVGGYAVAKRKGRPDFVVLMEVGEVEHLKNGHNALWKAYFNDMFKKHMKKRAIKGQFEIEFDEDEPLSQGPLDITPAYQAGANKTIEYTTGTAHPASPGAIQTGESEHQTPDQILAEKREEVRKKMQQAQMETWQLEELAMNKIGKLPMEMDARELIALCRHLDAEIASITTSAGQNSLFEDMPEELA